MNRAWSVPARMTLLLGTWALLFFSGARAQTPPPSPTPLPAPTPTPAPPKAKLTTLGETPEWRTLDRYQETLTRAAFEKDLWIYSPDYSFYEFIDLSDEGFKLYSDPEKTLPLWEFRFANQEGLRPVSLYRQVSADMRSVKGATTDKPLAGTRICLDPGHIGGDWANLEERFFRIKQEEPIEEGSLNIIVCRYLEKLLTDAGAEVVWTKNNFEPVTSLRPADLTWEGLQLLFRRTPKAYEKYYPKKKLLFEANWNAELAFYRPAEIGARARRVAELQPDLTICLHHNAAPWGNRYRPRLVNANKLIVFVLGCFMKDEFAYDDQKFSMMQKLLENSQDLEIAMADSIGDAMEKHLGFPPENYDSFAASRRVSGNRYVWSRNLLANRLFPGPTVFVEGPYMNDKGMYPRLQAGDYDGERLIGGQMVRSLFREYAESVANGIISYYRSELEKKPGN